MKIIPFGPDPRRLVPSGDRARVEAKLLMDQVLLIPGLRLAKDPANTPKDTGQLIGSIKVMPARWKGSILVGGLSVGVEYGRFQEYRNREKSLYLQRAIVAAELSMRKRLEGNAALARLGLSVRSGRDEA